MTTAIKICFPCKYPAKYDKQSIDWFRSEKMLCETHLEKANTIYPQPVKDREPGEEG